MEKFMGGSPGVVFIRLVVLSMIVGVVLAALGWQPFDVIEGIRGLVERLYDMGYEALLKGFSYFLTGALLVVPVWFVSRLLRLGKKPNEPHGREKQN